MCNTKTQKTEFETVVLGLGTSGFMSLQKSKFYTLYDPN